MWKGNLSEQAGYRYRTQDSLETGIHERRWVGRTGWMDSLWTPWPGPSTTAFGSCRYDDFGDGELCCAGQQWVSLGSDKAGWENERLSVINGS